MSVLCEGTIPSIIQDNNNIKTGCHLHNFLQEESRQLHGVMDVLLNFQQFQGVVPDGDLYYLPFGTLVLFEAITIPIATVEASVQQPLRVVKWNSFSLTLEAMSANVSKEVQLKMFASYYQTLDSSTCK